MGKCEYALIGSIRLKRTCICKWYVDFRWQDERSDIIDVGSGRGLAVLYGNWGTRSGRTEVQRRYGRGAVEWRCEDVWALLPFRALSHSPPRWPADFTAISGPIALATQVARRLYCHFGPYRTRHPGGPKTLLPFRALSHSPPRWPTKGPATLSK